MNVNGFGRIEQSDGFWHNGWRHPTYMLFYLAEGDLVMMTDAEELHMSAGDTLVVPPRTSYKPLRSNGCVYYYLYFHANEVEMYESDFSIKNSFCKGITNFAYSFNFTDRSVVSVQKLTRHTEDSRLGKIFSRCAELDMWQHPFEKMLLDNYLKEALIQLNLMQRKTVSVDNTFSRMVTFIQMNYKKDIGLKDVAQKVHLSESYAAKRFKKNAGMRCCDYINKVRLAAACESLNNTSMTLSEIAEDVGYKSQYYFARQFKKVYGMTAMQYRKRGMNNNTKDPQT